MKYDVVIIGGGPAGVSLGMSLLSNGYQCCIIDKAKFPREKLCAGVLTVKTQKLLNNIFPDLAWENIPYSIISTLNIYRKEKLVGKFNLKYAYKTVGRLQFDYELIKCFAAKGGDLFENAGKYNIDYENKRIIFSNQEFVEYSFLVGADGINSMVRKYVDPEYKPRALCFASFTSEKLCRNEINAHFGRIFGGYGWKIPCANVCNIGIAGTVLGKRNNHLNRYNSFCNDVYNIKNNKIQGHFLSDGAYVKKPAKDNVLLIGDAAGLVDAMSGEGIYFALYSGILAGEAIDEYYKNGSKMEYNKKIQSIHKLINQQKLFRMLLYIPVIQDITLFVVKRNSEWSKYFFDEIISTYNHTYMEAMEKLIKMRKKNGNNKLKQ